MKANEAPEKIYIQPNAHDGWFETNNLNVSLTEYTRTDAFIDKACEWLNNFYSEDRHCYLVAEDIKAFKQALEEQL